MAAELITDYSSLQNTIADWLNRDDLTSAIQVFISNAEDKFRRDKRLRKMVSRTLSVSAENTALPSDYKSLEALSHDGPTFYGPLDIVHPNRLYEIKGIFGDSGTPQAAAIVGDNLRVAPEPDGTYSLAMVYWATITKLSGTDTENWLIEDHPDLYLYAALVESAPYLKDDPRVAIWKQEYEERLNKAREFSDNHQWGSHMTRKPTRPIG